MHDEFETWLRSILDSPEFSESSTVKQDIQAVLTMGANSYQSIIHLAEGEGVDEHTRSIVCWILGRYKSKSSVTTLLKAFDEGGRLVAWEAAKSLGAIGSKRAIAPLINWLFHSPEMEKRAASAYALGALRDSRAIDSLLKVLQDKTEEPKVRGQAAEALGWLSDRTGQVIDALIASFGDKSVDVRFWSAYALGELRAESAENVLEKLSLADNEVVPGWWSVGKEASDALVRIRSNRN